MNTHQNQHQKAKFSHFLEVKPNQSFNTPTLYITFYATMLQKKQPNRSNHNKRCNGKNDQDTRSKKKRLVHFNDQKKQIVEFVALSKEDAKQVLWYTQKDLKDILRTKHLEESPPAPPSSSLDCSFSSFEKCAAQCSMEERQRRRHHNEFVTGLLRQQDEHRSLGIKDPIGLFQYSRACSKRSRQRALADGRNHAKHVKSFQERRQRTLDILDAALDLLSA